jgi:hypothetical protein
VRGTQTTKTPGLAKRSHGESKRSGKRPSGNCPPFPGWPMTLSQATKLRRWEVIEPTRWGKANMAQGYPSVPRAPEAGYQPLPARKGPATYLLKLPVFGSREERLGQLGTHHLNDLAESIGVNAGGRPETDVPSSRGAKPGRRRRPHSSRRPGKPATGRRGPGERRAARQLTGANLKW